MVRRVDVVCYPDEQRVGVRGHVLGVVAEEVPAEEGVLEVSREGFDDESGVACAEECLLWRLM